MEITITSLRRDSPISLEISSKEDTDEKHQSEEEREGKAISMTGDVSNEVNRRLSFDLAAFCRKTSDRSLIGAYIYSASSATGK